MVRPATRLWAQTFLLLVPSLFARRLIKHHHHGHAAQARSRPLTTSGKGPVDWLRDEYNEFITMVRRAWGDDEAPQKLLEAQGQRLHDNLLEHGTNIAPDFSRALQHCSWIMSAPEPRDTPIVFPLSEKSSFESENIEHEVRGVRFGVGTYKGVAFVQRVVAVDVDQDSDASAAGIVRGMFVQSVRGYAPSATEAMSLAEFQERLNSGDGPLQVTFHPPSHKQRRAAAVYQCARHIAMACGSADMRPLETAAFVLQPRQEDQVDSIRICASSTSRLAPYQSNGGAPQAYLTQGEVVQVNVPKPLVRIDLPHGGPEGLELSDDIVQVDSEASRERCLYAGMSLASINGQRLDAERPLDQLVGTWRYADGEHEYAIGWKDTNGDGRGDVQFFKETLDGNLLEGELSSEDAEGAESYEVDGQIWWWADISNENLDEPVMVRVKRDGSNMVSQKRVGHGDWQKPVRAVLATPVQHLQKGKPLSLLARPFGADTIQMRVQELSANRSDSCSGPGLSELVLFPTDATAWGTWGKAFEDAELVPVSFPEKDMRPSFQCSRFLADSFQEVSEALEEKARQGMKWLAIQVSISIASGVTAVAFPPLLGAHGLMAVGAGIGVNSVGTALKAGAHGAERMAMGGEFDLRRFGKELGAGVTINVLSAGVGVGAKELADVAQAAHGIVEGVKVGGEASTAITMEKTAEAVLSLGPDKNHTDHAGQLMAEHHEALGGLPAAAEPRQLSERCEALLYPVGSWY